MAQDVAILDIGSGKITVLTGKRGVNGTIIFTGKGQCDYAGYYEGEWIEPEKLAGAIGQAVSEAEKSLNQKITEIYVGVPGDFTTVVCKNVSLSFSRKRKVTEDDVKALHDQGDNFNDPNYALIHKQPIYYTLDDDRKLGVPEGLPSNRLSGNISYIFAEKSFLDNINIILSGLSIQKAEFVSSLLAEVLYLFEQNKRDQFVIMIDVGHIASSVVVARGEGILSQTSFAFGGGNITGELAIELGISFAQAENLKQKVLLSLDPAEDDVYQIIGKDNTISFRASEVNDIISEQLAKLASKITKALKKCTFDYPDNIPYHLTGGGIANISGAKDQLALMLEKPIEIAQPLLPHYKRPELSSMIGVLELCVSATSDEKPSGFWKRLLSFLGKN